MSGSRNVILYLDLCQVPITHVNHLLCLTIIYFHRISLNVMTLKVTSALVNSVQGVPISVTGIAQVFQKVKREYWHTRSKIRQYFGEEFYKVF